MNTFTKQELKYILEELIWAVDDPCDQITEQSERLAPIIKKIQLNIDRIDREEKTARKFYEWQKQIAEQQEEKKFIK